jgi:hypothetical protein
MDKVGGYVNRGAKVRKKRQHGGSMFSRVAAAAAVPLVLLGLHKLATRKKSRNGKKTRRMKRR